MNNGEGTSLTSALTGESDSGFFDNAENILLDENERETVLGETTTKKTIRKELEKATHEVEITLSFDRVPNIRKEAKIELLELKFDDLTTKINVNNDKLELNDLKEVNLKIEGFEGWLDFDELGISIEGKAKRIEVNDIALSSKGEIRLSFEDLDYQYLEIGEIELKSVELAKGDGELEITEKLSYSLEQEEVRIAYFDGQLIIDRSFDTNTEFIGFARGIGINGEILSLSLR